MRRHLALWALVGASAVLALLRLFDVLVLSWGYVAAPCWIAFVGWLAAGGGRRFGRDKR